MRLGNGFEKEKYIDLFSSLLDKALRSEDYAFENILEADEDEPSHDTSMEQVTIQTRFQSNISIKYFNQSIHFHQHYRVSLIKFTPIRLKASTHIQKTGKFISSIKDETKDQKLEEIGSKKVKVFQGLQTWHYTDRFRQQFFPLL